MLLANLAVTVQALPPVFAAAPWESGLIPVPCDMNVTEI